MNINELIPAKWRKPAYAVFALIGVILGAIATGFGPDNAPEWLGIASNVYLYVGGAFGLTAAVNVATVSPFPYEFPEGAEVGSFEDSDEVPGVADEVDETPVSDDYEPKH